MPRRVDLSRARRAGIRHFGRAVTYQPHEGGDPLAIRGTYFAPFQRLDVSGAEAPLTAQLPRLRINREEIPAGVRDGDRLTIEGIEGGASWDVVEVQEDGEGGADLILHLTV